MDTKNLSNEDIANLRGLLNLIKEPLVTSKTTQNDLEYTFLVDKRMNKTKLKIILEFIFNVSIIRINTSIRPQKKRTVGRFRGVKSQYKKVIIRLKKGDSINLFPNTYLN